MNNIDLDKVSIPYDILSLIPAKTARALTALPISVEDGIVTVCVKDKHNFRVSNTIEQITSLIAELVETDSEASLKRAVSFNYPESFVDGSINQAPELFRYLLRQAIHVGASDIHISPGKDVCTAKMRVDGKVRRGIDFSKQRATELSSYIKVQGKMDISQKRMPLDGNIETELDGREISLRVATVPTINGEHITLRLLTQSDNVLTLDSLEDLGLGDLQFNLLKQSLSVANGVVIISGPTGSGKTTTLYAGLRELVKDGVRHVVSIEDPVEKPIDKVTQIKVDSEGDRVSFHKALRSVLRHDPDVIMIGEIRDAETADIALKSALTGHLVLATLHTNSAPGILNRLVDLGAPDFLVASTLRLVIAQRLVRRPCALCMEWEVLPELMLDKYGWGDKSDVKVPKVKGCPYCGYTGYSGRTAIYEMLPVNSSVQQMLIENKSEVEIYNYLKDKAYNLTLRGDGLRKVLTGQTTLEEIESTTVNDNDALFNLEGTS